MTDNNKVLRRRVEDNLRKGSNQRLYKVAALLGIGCADHGGHEYAENSCPICGAVFCHACCGRTNRHEGGKHEPDFCLCPVCGHDICQD